MLIKFSAMQVRLPGEGKRSLLLEIRRNAAGSYLALINVGSVVWRQLSPAEMGTGRITTRERGGRGQRIGLPEHVK